jgi:hypothetical protein
MISASDKSRCLAYSPTPVIRERLTLFDPADPIQFAYFTSYRIVARSENGKYLCSIQAQNYVTLLSLFYQYFTFTLYFAVLRTDEIRGGNLAAMYERDMHFELYRFLFCFQ